MFYTCFDCEKLNRNLKISAIETLKHCHAYDLPYSFLQRNWPPWTICGLERHSWENIKRCILVRDNKFSCENCHTYGRFIGLIFGAKKQVKKSIYTAVL